MTQGMACFNMFGAGKGGNGGKGSNGGGKGGGKGGGGVARYFPFDSFAASKLQKVFKVV